MEAALATNKGKHATDTPRKRAIELAGNNARYQRAKDIGSHFDCRADAEEAAVAQSFNAILKEIAERKAVNRQAKGQEAPGRKPKASKIAKVVKPVANKAPVAEQDEASEEDNDQAAAEEIITIQPSVTPDELAAVNTFVTAVGGWERAIYVIEKGYEKWQQNQIS